MHAPKPRRTLPVLALLLALACRPGARTGDVDVGAEMVCGLRGHVLNLDGVPEVHTGVVIAAPDLGSRARAVTDEMGRFALPTDCGRLYAFSVEQPPDVPLAWIWVADAVVDVAVDAPKFSSRLVTRAVDPEDALRQQVFAAVPPTSTEAQPAACADRLRRLQDLGDRATTERTRQLVRVATLADGCGACPGPHEAAALAGSLVDASGVAEAWPSAYGRMFACTPGVHPHEAAFAAVVDRLAPELAARAVYARIVAADPADQARLWPALRTGRLANTAFVRDLPATVRPANGS